MTDTADSAAAPDDFWVTKNKDLMIGGGRSQGYAWSDKAKSMRGPHIRLKVGIFVFIAFQVVTMLTLISMLYLFWMIENGLELDAPTAQWLATVLAFSSLLPIALLVVFVGCLITYLMFVYRGMRNLQLSGARSVTTSPGWAVGGSFIPFANFFLIPAAMRQLWVGSRDPISGKYDPPFTLYLWWACWIGGGIFNYISATMVPGREVMPRLGRLDIFGAFLPGIVVNIVGELIGIASCFFLMSIIKQITNAQEMLRSTSAFDE